MKNELLLTANSPAPRPAPRAPRARWMVVDDNESLRELLASLLEALGVADVERCPSATAALAAFGTAPGRFQFVLTDLDMPGMNGIELCRRLHAVAPDLKIALATGSSVANEAGARQCGFCALLAKPFPAAALWRMVRAAGVLDQTEGCANN